MRVGGTNSHVPFQIRASYSSNIDQHHFGYFKAWVKVVGSRSSKVVRRVMRLSF